MSKKQIILEDSIDGSVVVQWEDDLVPEIGDKLRVKGVGYYQITERTLGVWLPGNSNVFRPMQEVVVQGKFLRHG